VVVGQKKSGVWGSKGWWCVSHPPAIIRIERRVEHSRVGLVTETTRSGSGSRQKAKRKTKGRGAESKGNPTKGSSAGAERSYIGTYFRSFSTIGTISYPGPTDVSGELILSHFLESIDGDGKGVVGRGRRHAIMNVSRRPYSEKYITTGGLPIMSNKMD